MSVVKSTDKPPFTPPEKSEKWDRSGMILNVKNEVIYDNIRTNIRRHIPQAAAHDENKEHVAIVGGGWSLDETFDELLALHYEGVKIVALNNSAAWLMERNIRPSAHVLMDARAENLYMVEKPIPRCKYFLASQCDPSLFDACADREVYVYHVGNHAKCAEEAAILKEHYGGRFQFCPGAGTVGNCAILLFRTLGFRFQHLFGFDSCYAPDGRHHAYPQPLNDGEGWRVFWCAGREFRCSAWQASAAGSFIDMIRAHKDLVSLSIHGDGVLAHMIKTGADLSLIEEDEVHDKGKKSVVKRKKKRKKRG